MRKIIPVLAMSLFVFGCANGGTKTPAPAHSDPATYNTHLSNYPGQRPHAGQWAVAAIGTPFYLVFKTAACGATLVVAAPAAAVLAIADSPYGMSVNQLGDGVAANCGPPYVLSPS